MKLGHVAIWGGRPRADARLTLPGGGRLELMHRPDIARMPDSSRSPDFIGYAHAGVEVGSLLAQSLRAAVRTRGCVVTTPDAGARVGSGAAFRQGLINNLANPKMAIFFPSVLPQFAPAGAGMLSALLALGLIFACLTMLWLGLYAMVVARAGRLVRDARMGRAIDAVAGIALVGLGVRVALSER